MISEAKTDAGTPAAGLLAAFPRSAFSWTLVGSFCAHLFLVAWVATQYPQPELRIDAPGFDVRLVRTPLQAPEPITPVDPIDPSAVTDTVDTTSKPAAQPPANTTSEVRSSPPTPITVDAVSALEQDKAVADGAAGGLNLSRPVEWERLATESPETLDSPVFKHSTRAAIAERRAQQSSSAALSRAQIERLGLAASDFRRRTAQGEEVKTAKGCFVKRLEHGPSGMQERWWRTACKDSRKQPWRREVLSYGADHRVESSPQSLDSDCSKERCWAY